MATLNFPDADVACRCGCGMLPDPAFMDKIQTLRTAFKKPLIVTSAARCPTHNDKVSGTGLTGPHTTGKAIDLAVSHADAHELLTMACRMGMFTGIGIQQKGSGRFIHLDNLPRVALWSY